jgi:hypothetical protein
MRSGYYPRSNILHEGTASLISDTSRIKALFFGLAFFGLAFFGLAFSAYRFLVKALFHDTILTELQDS